MNGQERRYNIEHQQNVLLNVLHRPIDVTTQSGRLEVIMAELVGTESFEQKVSQLL